MTTVSQPVSQPVTQPAPVPADHVRVITLNLWEFPSDVDQRLEAAAVEIAEQAPDVVCLQEVGVYDDDTSWAVTLAERTGMRLAAVSATSKGKFFSGLAVLTRLEVTGAAELKLPTPEGQRQGCALVIDLVSPSGRPLVVATTHLLWGGRAEAGRLEQAVAIDAHLSAHPLVAAGAVTVFCGDFNTGPTSDTLRFLLGEGVAQTPAGPASTMWTDTWTVSGHGTGTTSGPDNPWAAETARAVGIARPELLPHRRIDFILVRDFVFGRPGYPARAALAFETGRAVGADGGLVFASDHWGLVTDLWDPPLA